MKEIFADALELPKPERRRFLDSACSKDSALIAQIECLLAAYDSMGDFLTPRQGALSEGTVLCGRYRLVRFLGGGGMGEVYETLDEQLGVTIAIKVLRSLPEVRDSAQRFRREIQIARQITHPNICRVFDYHQHDDGLHKVEFISMELLPGETLARQLERRRHTKQEAIDIGLQLCEGLAAAHDRGIVHRDLKPANIMLSSNDRGYRVCIMDFGLARGILPAEGADGFQTVAGQVIGTPAYMAPEQLQDEPITQATDIYSLGVVLYELFTGSRPFDGGNPWASALKRLTVSPEPPHRRDPTVSSPVSETILRCLQRNPSRRFQSASEVRRSLLAREVPIKLLLVASASILVLITVLTSMYLSLPSALPAEKYLAVLPFQGDGLDPAFNDGIAGTFTTKLNHFRASQKSFWVVPFSEVRRQDVRSIAKAHAVYGVRLVIIGKLKKQSSGMECNLEVRDAVSDQRLRARSISVKEADLPRLGDLLVDAAASMLELKSPPEVDSLAKRDIASPGAYEFYEQGNGYLQRYGAENIDRAIELFQRALAKDPNYTMALAGLAQAYASRFSLTKDPEAAVRAQEACNLALSSDPNLVPAHLTQGILDLNAGNPKAAVDDFARARNIDPSRGETLVWLGRAYDAAGDSLQAESVFQSAIDMQPHYWAAFNNLGEFYYRHGQFAKAEPLFRTVIDLTPDNPLGFSNLGGLYLADERYDAAVEILQHALDLRPSPALFSNLGTAYFFTHRYEDAAGMFRKAADAMPNDYRMWRNLGDSLSLVGDRKAAQAAFSTCVSMAVQQLERNPRNSQVLSGKAVCDAKGGNAGSARTAIQSALAASPGDSGVLFDSGIVHMILGERKHAADDIHAALIAGYPKSEIINAPELAPLRSSTRFQEWARTNTRRIP
jgi:serine/threonine protein kinase/tetratricopeptide (TPR) repeat protein